MLTETTGFNALQRIAAIEAALYGDGLFSIDNANNVHLRVASAAPGDGTTGTGAGVDGTGSLYVNLLTGKLYINTGSKSSPTWTCVGDQS